MVFRAMAAKNSSALSGCFERVSAFREVWPAVHLGRELGAQEIDEHESGLPDLLHPGQPGFTLLTTLSPLPVGRFNNDKGSKENANRLEENRV